MMTQEEIQSAVKTFILNEFLPGEDPAALTDTTPLATTGILDSIAILKVVTFLESQFGITLEAHETGVENMNTVADISRLVMSKKA
jgi:acyl carrier protein